MSLVKYLGLQALGKLLPLRPNAVAEYGDVILECLRDHDASIRLRALDLVCSLVSRLYFFVSPL